MAASEHRSKWTTADEMQFLNSVRNNPAVLRGYINSFPHRQHHGLVSPTRVLRHAELLLANCVEAAH